MGAEPAGLPPQVSGRKQVIFFGQARQEGGRRLPLRQVYRSGEEIERVWTHNQGNSETTGASMPGQRWISVDWMGRNFAGKDDESR